jgi:hypothetical protein
MVKLTAEQAADVLIALMFGLSNHSWEGRAEGPWSELPRSLQENLLSAARRNFENHIPHVERTGGDPTFLKDAIKQHMIENLEELRAKEDAMRSDFLSRGTGPRIVRSMLATINEELTQACHFSAEMHRAVNRRLAAKGLPSLHELSAKLKKKQHGILKRGRIRTSDEYYIVKEIVCDQASHVSDAEREAFERMLGDYEARC